MARKTASLLSCDFCGQSQAEVNKLIAGPGVYICDRCVASAGAAKAEGRAVGDGPCSFCGKDNGSMLSAREVRIGPDCLELCEQILREQSDAG